MADSSVCTFTLQNEAEKRKELLLTKKKLTYCEHRRLYFSVTVALLEKPKPVSKVISKNVMPYQKVTNICLLTLVLVTCVLSL